MKRSDFESPEEVYGELFYDVHRSSLFEDGKLFADGVAKLHPSIIVKNYLQEKGGDNFSLDNFLQEYFEFQELEEVVLKNKPIPLKEHVIKLWDDLARTPDNIKKNRSSKIPLPHSYVVPGGRFNEIYYWDSYFTMLGLGVSKRGDLIEGMVDNFKFMIDTFGFIPNGNRSYFLSRSQPPFYSLMVKLLIKIKGAGIIPKYLPSLVTEYNFWMKGITDITDDNQPTHRIIRLQDNQLLNRYYDAKDTPREEMFKDDWKMIDFDASFHRDQFTHLRAACESGWDFSCRWLKDADDLKTIQTSNLLPIDLNSLIWHLEKLISECYSKLDEQELSLNYGILAHNRKKSINSIFWNTSTNYFHDYNWKEKSISPTLSLAGIYPLYFKLCSQEQADACAEVIKTTFLRDGGVVTTPYTTGQQWDAPNGWAPLQWMTIRGLLNYGHKDLAQTISDRWTALNEQVYERTGKMLEKYNVEDITLEGGGGEYPVQDGFGWTNGVYLALKETMKATDSSANG